MIRNRRNLILVLALAIIVIGIGILLSVLKFGSSGTPTQLADVSDRSVVSLLVGEVPIRVEVVNSSLSITQGLSGRESIGQDGMLFVLPQRQVISFWMKEMQFDLDLIWIDNGTIVGITSDVPAPETNTPLVDLPKFNSVAAVTQVLEVPAGTAKLHNWQVGSAVQLTD